MRRMMLAVVLAVVAFAGCGEGNKLEQGRILQKEYDDPDSWWTTQCVSYGKYGCSLSIPVEEHDGPHWSVRVVGYDKDSKQYKEWHEVTETLFDEVVIGDTVNFPNMVKVMA